VETLKHIENAVLDDGSLVKGNLYQVRKGDLYGGTAGHLLRASGTTQRFDLGARLVTADGRVFRYAKAGGTLVSGYGCEPWNQAHIKRGQIAANAPIGVTSVVVDVAATDGIQTAHAGPSNGVISKDELKGGYIAMEQIVGEVDNVQNRMILGNTATGVGGGEMTVEFDAPLDVALTEDTEYASCIASPYADVRTTTYNTGCIGVPCVIGAAGHYLWIQTWGMCWVTAQPRVGVEHGYCQLIFRHDGTVDTHLVTDASVAQQQHAGFLATGFKEWTGGYGAWVMLQISI